MSEEDRRTLPPMAMLHSFAAAARHGSFSRAAAEVGLTQSAISRQIANLEEWLGVSLFDRAGRRVRLNEAGRAYAEEVGAALGAIRRATARAMTRPSERVIELATLPSFGMRWLAPRLPRLTERHPDLIVNFAARSDEFDFATEPFDAAIHFGRPDWPGAVCDLLFREAAIPVVSPALAEGLSEPRDLARLPLLVQSNRRDAWARWFALAGVDHVPEGPLPGFSHFLMLAQAAAAGAGAALVPSFLIEPELASGALVRPFDLALPSERAYYLAYPAAKLESSAFRQLRDWMLAEAAVTTSTRPA
ncbi:transcriptional regulator GcvA [Sphingomonas sp. PR090111-T3T-6A]|uniref:transcriptional regulator GcvA n=1 Tax=Sphingomonas sp. PR090111-T3T-6A TaxID=685778 RepID=UPI00037E87D5|nr:transcriptional regulator GcvA [Sphingomonas sp. PR090111-T3T-6A]